MNGLPDPIGVPGALNNAQLYVVAPDPFKAALLPIQIELGVADAVTTG